MLSLLMLGCSEPIFYPSLPAAVSADTDTVVDTDTGDDVEIPCSGVSSTPAGLTILNGASVGVEVFWRDPGCVETRYHTLGPGDSVYQQTYTTHVWVARALSGGYLDDVTVDTDTSWEITP